MKRFATVLFALLLFGCTDLGLPLSKPEPVVVNNDSLLQPPWEALVKAGPEAENDIDLETLNGPQNPAEPPPVLDPAPQKIAATPEPKRSPPKPGDIEIKAVAVLPVEGGGAELTVAMRKVLKNAGWRVLPAARADALEIRGRIFIDEPVDGQQLVHIIWVVSTPKGKILGDIKQNNPVAAGSLDSGWGKNAGYAAQAAAEGIFKLIEKFR